MEVKSKPWYESITVWGVIITTISGILGLIGITIGPDTQQQAIDIVPKAVEALARKDWVAAINSVITFVGIVMAAMGRNQAVQPVHFVKSFTVAVEPKVLAVAEKTP